MRTKLPLSSRGVALLASFCCVVLSHAKGDSSSSIYNTTNVWTAEFKFSPEQWAKMMPTNSGNFPGGPGPGRRGGPGGRAGGFGPGMFLGPMFLKAGDSNGDKQLTRDEATALSEKWFGEWDKERNGKLEQADLRDGLSKNFVFPGPGGPGRPGGGLWLQGKEGQRNGLASAAGIEFQYVHADLRLGNYPFTNVAVRYKGNGTWMESRGSEKHSMKVDLNEFVKGQKLSGISKLNFHNCVTDPSYMNEVLAYKLYRDAGVPAPRTAYAKVNLNTGDSDNARYLGLYSMVENVDANFIKDWFGTKQGAIFKPVTPAPFTDLGADWAKYNQTYDPKTKLTELEKRRIIQFCQLVSHADDEEFATRLGDYLDLDNFSRFMAVTVWLCNLDSILGPGQNYYVYLHPNTAKLHFIPWDLDHSFGQFPMMGNQQQREKLSIEKPWQGENRFLQRVFAVEAFQKLYKARLEEFSHSLFKAERFARQVDEIAAAIRPAVQSESGDKLERLNKVAAGEPVGRAGFGGAPNRDAQRPSPERQFGPPGFGQPIKPIKSFVVERALSVSNQLAHRSDGETLQPGFGGPGGPGRPGRPPGAGGPGEEGFGPGAMMAMGFQMLLDTDKDSSVSHEEFVTGFKKWFDSWDSDHSNSLNEEQLRSGLNETFRPPPSQEPGEDRPFRRDAASPPPNGREK